MTTTDLFTTVESAPRPAASTTATAMIHMLRRHYLPDETRPAGVFAPDIQAPGPVQRRADLIWLGCTAAAGSHLVGHEVKVTRQDLLAELGDLTKSDPWQRYCDRWWLVVPDLSLIRGLEIPESWGVMLPPSGRRTRSMSVHRPAPPLRPLEQAPALRTLTAWQHWKLRDAYNRVEALRKQCEQLNHANAQLRLTGPPQHPNPERDVVARIVRELGGADGFDAEAVGRWPRAVKVEDVVAVLRDLGDAYRRRDGATRALKNTEHHLEFALKQITQVLGEIQARGARS
jgi:hypothetical protein